MRRLSHVVTILNLALLVTGCATGGTGNPLVDWIDDRFIDDSQAMVDIDATVSFQGDIQWEKLEFTTPFENLKPSVQAEARELGFEEGDTVVLRVEPGFRHSFWLARSGRWSTPSNGD